MICNSPENFYETFKKIKKLFDLNIPEERLNFLLCNTHDLELLCIALEIKLGLINDNLQSYINFPVDQIIKQTTSDNIEKVCNVLRLALLVQSNDNQYKISIEIIEANLKFEKNEVKLLNTLKLLQFLISLQDFKKLHLSIDNLCNLLFYNSKCVTNFLTVFIFPKLLENNLSYKNQIFDTIWKSTQKTKDLTSFCALSNDFDKTSTFFKCDNFWFLLQECLHLKHFQKQAVYLLKKSLQVLQHEESFNTKSRIISWDSHTKNDFDIAWVNYFILIEVLKEKQLHLVEPSYQLLPSVQILHPTWLLILYKILLTHPHNSVRAYAIVNVLKSTWWHKSQDIYRDLIRILLPALNYNDNVSKSEVWDQLCIFSQKLIENYFTILLEETIQIIWLPSVCYLFYFSILNNHQVSSVLIDKLLNNIEKLPHKFLRNSCRNVIRNSIFKSKFNFKEYLDISWNFYKNDNFFVEESEALEYSNDVKLMIDTWCSNDINLKHTLIVLNMLQLPSFHKEALQLHNLFLQKKLSCEISDEVALLLCKKNLMSDLPVYIEERLTRQNCDKKIKHILPFLKKCTNGEDLLRLYNVCLEIIEHHESSNLQVAYEAANIILEQTGTCLQHPEFYDNWKREFFQNSQNINIALFLKSYFNVLLQNWSDGLAIFERAMEVHNHEILPEISSQLKHLLNASLYGEEMKSFIDICVKNIIESKRTDCFKPAILNLISSMFNNNKIGSDREFLNQVLCITKTALDLAKLYEYIAYSLAQNLEVTLTKNHHLVAYFIPTLVDLLLFGEILKSDQRAEYLVCQKIYKDNQTPNNPNFQRLSIIVQAVNTLNNFLCNESIDTELKSKWADQIFVILMEKYMIHFNKRYFADSMIHLQKLRILQALLVVQKHITEQKDPLIDFLMNSLCLESHQSSVKFLIQWLLIELLRKNNNCITLITSKMEHTSKVQPSTIIAFVPILYHLTLITNDEQFWFNLIETILPWTMGPHFNLRLYAQEGLLCVYEQAQNRNLTNLVATFKPSIECIKSVLKKTERTLDPIDKFVFHQFNSEQFYNLHTIYFSIPQFTNVTYDAYENFINIKDFPCNPNVINLPIMRTLKVIQGNKEPYRSEIIQKKVIPWTPLFENDVKKAKLNDLIVVASLVDKITNLGGISRTCEVFGVKQLALHSISSVKDNDFRSLSMSSENWIDIIEVKLENLRTFLLEMKEKEYVVVGAEQTSNSVNLDKFRFPNKCVLVLGNEKEGISPYILPLIDFCVEIPQFGVVRSLNVHVAAATFIWEYTKQHVIS